MNVADTELILGHLAGHGWDARRAARRRRRHPAQHLRHPRARRGAGPRAAGRPGTPQGAAPATCASASRAAWRSTCAQRCASVRPRSTSWSGPTATATCPRSSPRRPPIRTSGCASAATRPTPTSRWPARPACGPGSPSCAAATASARSASCPTCAAASAACRRRRSSSRCARRSTAARARSSSSGRPSTRTATTTGTSRACCARRPPCRGVARLRFTSPHPADMTEAVIDAMAECPAVMPQLHLPVQSGSDRVLARMARDYDVARVRGAGGRGCASASPASRCPPTSSSVSRARRTSDFAATESAPAPRYATTRPSSSATPPREGTRAAKWDDDVPDDEKGRRLERLIALQETISGECNRALLGCDVDVLVEGAGAASRRAG